ncbi:MAG: hypothetical protein FJX57_08175 [Alphaproteobacteria bacterium]|nr:hypothetical protein [Alphaproteobacteria bacterium]
MARTAKSSKRRAPKTKPKSRKAAPIPVSTKTFAAALVRIAALEREIAALRDGPVRSGPGGDVTIEAGTALVLRAATIRLEASALVRIETAQAAITAAVVTVEASALNSSGVVSCDTLRANAVVAASYTPGAGNVW